MCRPLKTASDQLAPLEPRHDHSPPQLPDDEEQQQQQLQPEPQPPQPQPQAKLPIGLSPASAIVTDKGPTYDIEANPQVPSPARHKWMHAFRKVMAITEVSRCFSLI